ncbi:MAG: VOC family protein [Nocardioidaceae bacterium]
MAYDFQVVIDCAEPHPLADWWAQALGWQVEATDEDFITEMVSKGFADEAETATYRGALVWKTGAAISPADEPQSGPRRRILFQWVPEPKTVKNRVHLDVWVGRDHVEEEVERLVASGGRFLHRGSQGPHSWVTLADPEGNELCLS